MFIAIFILAIVSILMKPYNTVLQPGNHQQKRESFYSIDFDL